MKPQKRHLYLAVMLNRKTYNIHRLVAITFIPNELKKPCVNHINGVKYDNRSENLEWVTYSENELHSFRVLGKKPNKSALGKFGYDNPSSKEVAQILDDKIIAKYGSASEAARSLRDGKHKKATQGRISSCCRGERKTTYGFNWRYV